MYFCLSKGCGWHGDIHESTREYQLPPCPRCGLATTFRKPEAGLHVENVHVDVMVTVVQSFEVARLVDGSDKEYDELHERLFRQYLEKARGDVDRLELPDGFSVDNVEIETY